MKRAVILVLGVVLASSMVAAAVARTPRHAARAHAATFFTLNLTRTKAGSVLTNTSGSILYEFSKDPAKKDTCAAIKGCAKIWEPQPTTGNDTAGPGVKASLISSIEVKTVGYKQITYAGHPLYVYAPAPTRASVIGTASDGGHWYALNAKGQAVK